MHFFLDAATLAFQTFHMLPFLWNRIIATVVRTRVGIESKCNMNTRPELHALSAQGDNFQTDGREIVTSNFVCLMHHDIHEKKSPEFKIQVYLEIIRLSSQLDNEAMTFKPGK